MEELQFSDGASDNAPHTVHITIMNGTTAPSGTALTGFNPLAITLTGANAATPGTITAFLDLGTSNVASPMTIFVTAT